MELDMLREQNACNVWEKIVKVILETGSSPGTKQWLVSIRRTICICFDNQHNKTTAGIAQDCNVLQEKCVPSKYYTIEFRVMHCFRKPKPSECTTRLAIFGM
jgi:hypothetical protein